MSAAILSHGTPAALRERVVGTALWCFIGVASTLFALFLTAYAMRMDGAADWTRIALPAQLWLSSAVLLAGSVLMQLAAAAARGRWWARARRLLLAGGAAAVAFLGVQLWAWQDLLDARVALAGNPAASFFYVLTALHGLHVIGGLVAWSIAAQSLAADEEAHSAAWRIALCARYWHLLLAVWAVLFAALGWLTPEMVRVICGRA